MNGAMAELPANTNKIPISNNTRIKGANQNFLRSITNCKISFKKSILIFFEMRYPFVFVFPVVLALFGKYIIIYNQIVHVSAHKTPVGIHGCAYNRLASYIKTGID